MLRTITFGSYQYDFIAAENGLEQGVQWLEKLETDRYMLITDNGVPGLIVEQARSALQAAGEVEVLTFACGEKDKNLTTVQQLAENVIELGADRRTVIVALGGGIVGNIAGMVAGLLFRGLPLVHIPTTMMAASDSVLSLKQAVNLSHGKNLIGMYYAPKLVCVHLPFLLSLPEREVRSGQCELVKNLLAICPEEIDRFTGILRPDNQYTMEELLVCIEFCIEAKMSVMRQDPYEKNEALVLEYGHTIGHALELAAGGALTHGDSIAFGMQCAAHIGQDLGLLTKDEVEMHHQLLRQINVQVVPEAGWLRELSRYYGRDNKRGYRKQEPGKTGFILLNGLGRMHQQDGSWMTPIPNEKVEEAILAQTGLQKGMAIRGMST
ncbi:2-deoxy-scyllo-inosose synthase [Marinicrinis sediminis]|uniref:2-deoxy-scyllo-inosose synthase n=1 Tax=Marinicrinis sediminis TaxID=1652465 RepID=A0ABW5R7N5_9BACL